MKKIIFTMIIGLNILIVSCTSSKERSIDEQHSINEEIVKEENDSKEIVDSIEVDGLEGEEQIEEVPETKEINLIAVGDVMIHRSQLKRAYNPQSDTFDFWDAFEMIDEFIKPYDYATANLETTLSGKDEGIRLEQSNYYKGYQGYPTFNSPEVLATNIVDTGFDLVTTANNHCFDSWNGGVINTINVLDDVGLDHVGTYSTPSESRVLVKEIDGIKLAFFNYTYSTNGINPNPEDVYMVNSLDNYNPIKLQQMYDEVRAFTQANNDIDLNYVYIHFGNEYHIYPSTLQQVIVEELIKAGADIIVGTHPHVLQPMELLEVELDDGSTKEGLVFYSLGNFLSSQVYLSNDPVPKDVGIIVNMTIKKTGKNRAYVSEVGLIPTWVQWMNDNIRAIPVDKAISLYNQDFNYYLLKEKDYNRLVQVEEWTIDHFTSYMENEPRRVLDQYVLKLSRPVQYQN